MMKRIINYLVLSFFILGCKSELPNKHEAVLTFYDIKKQELFDLKAKECKEDIQVEAKLALDSIVHKLLNADLMDTIDFPFKPIKPQRPEDIIGTVKKFDIYETN